MDPSHLVRCFYREYRRAFPLLACRTLTDTCAIPLLEMGPRVFLSHVLRLRYPLDRRFGRTIKSKYSQLL